MRSLEQSDALADTLNGPLLNVQLQAELQRRSFIGEATIDKESTIGPGSIPEEPPSRVPLKEILGIVGAAISILLLALKYLSEERSKTIKKNDNLKEVVLKEAQKSMANLTGPRALQMQANPLHVRAPVKVKSIYRP
jgi:hypothetical protein